MGTVYSPVAKWSKLEGIINSQILQLAVRRSPSRKSIFGSDQWNSVILLTCTDWQLFASVCCTICWSPETNVWLLSTYIYIQSMFKLYLSKEIVKLSCDLAPKLWNSLPISLCTLCPWHGSGFNPFTSVKHFATVLCPEKCYKNKLYLHTQTYWSSTKHEFLGLTSWGTGPCYNRIPHKVSQIRRLRGSCKILQQVDKY